MGVSPVRVFVPLLVSHTYIKEEDVYQTFQHAYVKTLMVKKEGAFIENRLHRRANEHIIPETQHQEMPCDYY